MTNYAVNLISLKPSAMDFWVNSLTFRHRKRVNSLKDTGVTKLLPWAHLKGVKKIFFGGGGDILEIFNNNLIMLFKSAQIACIRHIFSIVFQCFLHKIFQCFFQNIQNVFSAKKEQIGFQTQLFRVTNSHIFKM